MKKIFRNIVVSFICVCTFLNTTNGDVYLTDQKVGDESEFIEFINKRLEQELSLERFPSNINWQMPGCAVFFPKEYDTPQRVYVAKKRKHNAGDYVANNTNDPNGHVFNYTSNMHTERQLAIVALEEALRQNSLQVAEEEDKSKHFLKGAKIPLEKESFPAPEEDGRYDLKGTLCIYTEYSPCKAGKQESGHLGCVEYYQLIASIFENIKFRVYFKNTDNFFDDKYVWPADALTSLSNFSKRKLVINNISNVKCFNKSVFGNERDPLFSKEELETIKSNKTVEMFNRLYNTKSLKNLSFHIIHQ